MDQQKKQLKLAATEASITAKHGLCLSSPFQKPARHLISCVSLIVLSSTSRALIWRNSNRKMTEIKPESPKEQRLIIAHQPDISDPDKRLKPKRVASLDIFRGLTVALMILVDDAGGEWPVIGHAPWNGCNLADFVMPFFLFIVGMAIALAFKRISSLRLALEKVILRTLKLLFWGILLQG